MKRQILIQSMAALLILIFVYAAFSKLLNYPLFVAQLEMHPLLKHFAGLFAWSIPVTECIIAILLIFSFTRMAGFYCSALLLLIFTFYLTGMVLTDKHLPCSCGGIISGFSWKEHIVFNIACIAIAIIGIVLNRKVTKNIVATIHPNSSRGVN